MTSRKSQGKTFILATAGVAVLAWAGITFLPTDSVVAGNGPKPSFGTLACGGYYRTAGKNKKARWVFKNHNETAINITGFRVYDYTGSLFYDSSVSGLPADQYGHLGPDNTLEPYQTASYWSETLYGNGVLPAHTTWRGHVTIHVDWEAAVPDTPVDALAGTTVNQDRDASENMLAKGQSKCGDI